MTLITPTEDFAPVQAVITLIVRNQDEETGASPAYEFTLPTSDPFQTLNDEVITAVMDAAYGVLFAAFPEKDISRTVAYVGASTVVIST
jgi:hypothetical protein